MTHAAFWDKTAPKYANKKIANPRAYEATLAATRDFLKPDDIVLEIGCGTGSTAIALSPAVAQMTGTDISGEMIHIAKGKLADSRAQNVTFAKAAVGDAIPGAPYDAVLAFSLLHLVDDLPQALAEVKAQLKPGGLFISKTPCLGDRARGLRVMVWALSRLGLAPDVRFLTRDGQTNALKNAGFAIEQIATFDTAWANPYIIARAS